MSVSAKCHNYTGCMKAHQGEVIHLSSGAPLVCPECGKPLTMGASAKSSGGKTVLWLVIFGVIGVGAYFGLQSLSSKPGTTPATPTPPPVSGSSTPIIAANPTPEEHRPSTPEPSDSDGPSNAVSPDQFNLKISDSENQRVREEVLTRIDLMPNLSQANRDKLHNSVERARGMGMVISIPFAAGKTSLSPAEIQVLKDVLDRPNLMKLRDDPTAVFVVLGYADAKGDERKNLPVSQKRADSVLDAMRDKCNVANVMHSVAMGGSTLHDSASLEKNRVVEVWAVLP